MLRTSTKPYQFIFIENPHFCSYTGCGNGWVENPKLRMYVHKSITSRSVLFAKDMIFGKQKFDVKQLEDEQFYV